MHGLYSKYECDGQMDQPVKNAKFALMGNFCLWKAFSRPMILTVQYIIRTDIFFFEFRVCALNKLNYMVNNPCHLYYTVECSFCSLPESSLQIKIINSNRIVGFSELKGSLKMGIIPSTHNSKGRLRPRQATGLALGPLTG